MSEDEHCKAEPEVTERQRGEVNADHNMSCKVDELQIDEEEFGVRRPVRKQDPREPTKAEREEHDKTHLPFRSWCRHCVRGRGKEEACRRVGRDPEVPEIHMDFMFMGEEEGGRTLAMLVVRERSSRAVMACVAPAKSSVDFLAKKKGIGIYEGVWMRVGSGDCEERQ